MIHNEEVQEPSMIVKMPPVLECQCCQENNQTQEKQEQRLLSWKLLLLLIIASASLISIVVISHQLIIRHLGHHHHDSDPVTLEIKIPEHGWMSNQGKETLVIIFNN